ncbi:hypothetical protein [Metapseudomonas otitidis]|uniref:hypothetical protein n=1 Tax=Metapseudomonas otitidis TaxID=319939 RepID=UPI00209716CB|nr:hypothetical protein [Pseudomonas otitidis]MCO7556145.1 hypothetical protein [Pseudomonas otitidis]
MNKDQHPNADDAFEAEFMAWWEKNGQYCRSGGGDYERSFAFEAWRHLYPKLMQARAARSAPHADGMADAYVGAREDLAIWKRRALEAEQKVRVLDQRIDQLVLEAQGETRMGEPHIAPPAALSAPPAAGVPEGWKLVPMEPTAQMTHFGQQLRYDAVNSIGHIYRTMLAAAPTPPAPEQQPHECTCVYATAKNTAAVRNGSEMGGYLKAECVACQQRRQSRPASEQQMAVVMPEWKCTANLGWNACLDELLRLNPHLAKGEGV